MCCQYVAKSIDWSAWTARTLLPFVVTASTRGQPEIRQAALLVFVKRKSPPSCIATPPRRTNETASSAPLHRGTPTTAARPGIETRLEPVSANE